MRTTLVFAGLFACLVVVLFVVTYFTAAISFATTGTFPPDWFCILLFAPALLSDVTGAGVIPFEDALCGGCLAMWMNSLVWAVTLVGLWLAWWWSSRKFQGTSTRGADGSPPPARLDHTL